jgi:HEPN domain-containing protein
MTPLARDGNTVKWREHAELLLRKATQDEYLLDRMLDDPHAPPELFGFHAQQAIEKLLKALLSDLRVSYPRTHRLIDLMDLAVGAGYPLPEDLAELRHLTPFAVEFRYDALPEEAEAPLDKARTRARVGQLRAFVQAAIASRAKRGEA